MMGALSSAAIPVYYYTSKGIIYTAGSQSDDVVINAAKGAAGYVYDNKGNISLVVAESWADYDQAVSATNALKSGSGNEIVKATGSFIFGTVVGALVVGGGWAPLLVGMLAGAAYESSIDLLNAAFFPYDPYKDLGRR